MYLSSNNNRENDNLERIVKKVIEYLVVSGISILGYHLISKARNIPKSKTETIDKAKEDFYTNHSEFGGISPITDNEIEANNTSNIANNEYLLFGSFIHSGEIAVIVADAKVGKTLLACYLARNLETKKAVYFSLDDIGSSQWYRFTQNSTIRYIKRHEFDGLLDDIKSSVIRSCGEQAYRDTICKFASQIENRKEKLQIKYGVYDNQDIEYLFLFELLMQSKLCAEADVVILDSLNALVKYEWLINRPCIEKIINYRRKIGKTMIILHHTNSKNQCAGSQALPQVVDLVLKMDKVEESNIRKISVVNDRYLQNVNSCYVRMIEGENQQVSFELCDEHIIQQQLSLTPLERKIIDALGDNDSIFLNDLSKIIGASNDGSLKNSLLSLEKKGYVAKDNEKSWEMIKNCMKNNTAL